MESTQTANANMNQTQGQGTDSSQHESQGQSVEKLGHTAILNAYKHHVLTIGKRPISVYAFMQNMHRSEAEFYTHFTSFDALEQHIWAGYLSDTRARLHNEPSYPNYSVREKLLAFYYTWVEVLRPERSFIEWSRTAYARAGGMGGVSMRTPMPYRKLKDGFMAYADELINEGFDKGELVGRPILQDRYADGLYLQLLFVTDYWRKDTSAGFEDTDAAIEKAVRLSFELMGQNVADAAFDFARFVLGSRKRASRN
jgi:AcrR family transcriptional regulator